MQVTMETAFLIARSLLCFQSPFSAHLLALLYSSSIGTGGKLGTSSVHDILFSAEQHHQSGFHNLCCSRAISVSSAALRGA